jgi:hypothetical protein
MGALKLRRDGKTRRHSVLWGIKTEKRRKISQQFGTGGGGYQTENARKLSQQFGTAGN